MINITEELQKSEGSTLSILHRLFKQVMTEGSSKDREDLAQEYLSYFGQCCYDHICNKYNKLEWIWELDEVIENTQKLTPDFLQYHFSKATIYKMLTKVTGENTDKIAFLEKAIYHYRKQYTIEEDDFSLLTDLTEVLFSFYTLTNYPEDVLNEIRDIYIKAFIMEQEAETKNSFFGLNEFAISSFFPISYQILNLPLEDKETIHHEFSTPFLETISKYAEKNNLLYYHWIEALFELTDNVEYLEDHPKRITEETAGHIWKKIVSLSEHITDIDTDQELFLITLGQKFLAIGDLKDSIAHYQTAYNYFMKGFSIHKKSINIPNCVATALQRIALVQLESKELEEAKNTFSKGFAMFEEALTHTPDFAIYTQYGNYIYNYAQYFEHFSNTTTLQKAKQQFLQSIKVESNYNTVSYYAFAKTALKLGEKEEALKMLQDACIIFSSEYSTHRFEEIIDTETFLPIKKELLSIIEQVELSNKSK